MSKCPVCDLLVVRNVKTMIIIYDVMTARIESSVSLVHLLWPSMVQTTWKFTFCIESPS